MMSDPPTKCGNLRYAITYVIWVNKKTESFEYHWLRAFAMFDIISFPASWKGIGRHFKFFVMLCYLQKANINILWQCICILTLYFYLIKTVKKLQTLFSISQTFSILKYLYFSATLQRLCPVLTTSVWIVAPTRTSHCVRRAAFSSTLKTTPTDQSTTPMSSYIHAISMTSIYIYIFYKNIYFLQH